MIAEADGGDASIRGMSSGALVLLGCGWIARRHAAAARRLGLPVIFASRDAARAHGYARAFGGIDAVGDYGAALADSRAVAAVVCTPHDRHLDDALAALAAGKHVLVEKPMGRTLEEADRMIAAAAAAGRMLMVAENFHWMPAFRQVRRWLDEGRLGPLREIRLVARGLRRHAGWRAAAGRMGGGTLIDGGIHYVHALRWWGGEVRSLYALSPPRTLADFEGEDCISLLATLSGGAVGLVSSSLAAPGVPRLQWSTLTGTRATCFADNRGRVLVVRGAGGTRMRVFPRDVRGHEAMLRAFRDAVTTGKPPETDGADGRRDLAIVLAAYRSVAERRAVEVAC
jgi:UDP-N-acetyl-2-amino-2-deoxyglucuronate dehydrogenase